MRAKIYRFSFDVLKIMLSPGVHKQGNYDVVDDGLPPDAELVNVQYTWPYGGVDLLIRSKTFPEVPKGEVIPVVGPSIRPL